MRTIKIILCSFILLLLAGCAQEAPPVVDISGYLDRLSAMDFAGMFSYTSPTADIDAQAFEEKYNVIFSGLGVESVRIDEVSQPAEDGGISFTATYRTREFGDFTNVFDVQTGFVEGRCMVLWDHSLIFPEMREGYTVRVQTLHAQRGEIFAADGSLLAKNDYADTIYMDPAKVADIDAVADAVLPLIDMTNTELVALLDEALEAGETAVALGAFSPGTLTQAQRDALLAVPGLGIDDKMYTPIRSYPTGILSAHMVGYTGYYSEDELPEGYESSDKAGVSGLEAAYETQLRGIDGKTVYIEDKWGRSVRTLYLDPMSEGQDLRLTIDPLMQQRAYNALSGYLEGDETGVAIVMDARTGYMEAMVSYPSYDNNLFTFGVSEETWEYLNDPESNEPLFARATQGLYPPGSAFKPFTATAALEVGAISPESVFDGEIIKNQWKPADEDWIWDPITRVDDSGTPLKLYNALVSSDNIYFAWAALRLGDYSFVKYMEEIGMEQAVPFDLPVKSASLLKSTTQIDRRLLADMGYGQGELLVTPLQLAAMYTAFANESGDMMQPILVQQICQTTDGDYVTLEDRAPTVWVQGGVPQPSLDVLLPILHDVVQEGTGKPVRIPGVRIAGKTGTAEIGDDKSREISWFAGYWEDGNYDRLVVVMVDTAAGEGAVKFDIAKALLMP